MTFLILGIIAIAVLGLYIFMHIVDGPNSRVIVAEVVLSLIIILCAVLSIILPHKYGTEYFVPEKITQTEEATIVVYKGETYISEEAGVCVAPSNNIWVVQTIYSNAFKKAIATEYAPAVLKKKTSTE